jgi:hypothetical protein
MNVGQFPASAANSLIEGYCDDFVSLAATMAQTLEQVSMRSIPIDGSRPSLERIENGLRALADAIQDLLQRGGVLGGLDGVRGAKTDPAPASVAHRAGGGRGPGAHTPAPHSPPPHAPAHAPAARGPAPAAPGPAPAQGRSEVLNGTNKSMPLLSICQFLGRMRKTGTMRVSFDGANASFDFANGAIRFTTCDRCPAGERLSEILVELGFCAREALTNVVAQLGTLSSYRLGQAVIEAGLCSHAQVVTALELQVKRRFQRACKSPEAAYEFEEAAQSAGSGRSRVLPFELAFEPTRIG